jgi:hypothetical protein
LLIGFKLLSELDQQWTDVSKFIKEETNKVKKNQDITATK